MLEDKDLRSIQEARTLVAQVSDAQKELAKFSQEQIDAIVARMAEAARRESERLARMAVEETGYGNVADKTKKNLFSAEIVYNYIKNLKTVGIIKEDDENKIIEIATPMGVVAGIIPTTNPTSTAIFKCLIALKAGNGIVLSPHPSAVKCITEAARVVYEAARSAGAPAHIIACMSAPTIEGTQELMRHKRTSIILATGGAGLVRAAYSSGKPALGVGPGNVPAFIERTADVTKAVRDVLAGKCFDYGTLCSSENSVVVDEPINEKTMDAFEANGGYFLTPLQAEALAKLVVLPSKTLNTQVVGKAATVIADMAGIKVPDGTRALLVKLGGVGKEYPLSMEKLAPILSYYVVKDWREGSARCNEILNFGGMGHTLTIHSKDTEVIKAFALMNPAFRVCVNTLASIGAVGYTTNLVPSMTLGCGTLGGNITSDNIGPLNLLNIKRVAFETRPFTAKADAPAARLASAAAVGREEPKINRDVIRQIVDELLSKKGDKRSAPLLTGSSSGGDPNPTPPRAPKPAGSPPISDFVSEDDVRRAIAKNEKIHIGSRTIITPLARDLGNENDIFVT